MECTFTIMSLRAFERDNFFKTSVRGIEYKAERMVDLGDQLHEALKDKDFYKCEIHAFKFASPNVRKVAKKRLYVEFMRDHSIDRELEKKKPLEGDFLTPVIIQRSQVEFKLCR